MPGYDFEINGKEVLDFICCICLMLIRKALLLPCSHTACMDCLEKWENEHPGRSKCPTCNKTYDKEKVREGEQGKFIDRVVTSSLKIKCKEWEQGCKWVGTITEYDTHEKTCAYLQLPCRFDGCKKIVARKDMATHEMNCPHRLVTCNLCQSNIAFTKRKDHLNLCEEYQVECPNDRCDKKMKRKELNHHIAEICPFTILLCSFKNIGCSFQMARCESEKHNVESSSLHSSLLLKTTDSLTNQLKEQQLDFQRQFQQQQQQFLVQLRQQAQQFQEQLKQQQLHQEKRHTEEMEILRKRLNKFEQLARLERLEPTKEELSALTKEEETHDWTYEELGNFFDTKQFDMVNAVLLSLGELSNKQKIGENSHNLFQWASSRGAPIRTLQLLREKGCNLRERDKFNDLPIHDAAVRNKFKVVNWMLHEDISLVNIKGQYEYTPLHYAAMKNHKKTVQLLLSYGADVNAEGVDGRKADELLPVQDEIKKMIREYRHW